MSIDNDNVKKIFDDSALQQGRRALRTREVGETVHPKHMTPKEYRNFSVGLWDGIETRPDIQDWSAWKWPEEAELKPKKPAERRTKPERRDKRERYKGANKRKQPRRKEEKEDLWAFHVCSTVAYLTILTLTVLVIIYNVDFRVIK